MSDRPFTIRDSTLLEPILQAAQGNLRVVRLIAFPDDERLIEGTARSIGNEDFTFDTAGSDVRDLFLRVTTHLGVEHAWAVDQLMHDVHTGHFAIKR